MKILKIITNSIEDLEIVNMTIYKKEADHLRIVDNQLLFIKKLKT